MHRDTGENRIRGRNRVGTSRGLGCSGPWFRRRRSGDDVVSVRTEGEQQGSADLRAVGHFDGDRALDEAFFRRTQAGSHELVVSLSSKASLVALAELDAVDNMGVRALGPAAMPPSAGRATAGSIAMGRTRSSIWSQTACCSSSTRVRRACSTGRQACSSRCSSPVSASGGKGVGVPNRGLAEIVFGKPERSDRGRSVKRAGRGRRRARQSRRGPVPSTPSRAMRPVSRRGCLLLAE